MKQRRSWPSIRRPAAATSASTNPGPNGGVVDPQSDRVVNPVDAREPAAHRELVDQLFADVGDQHRRGRDRRRRCNRRYGGVTIAGTAGTGTLPIVASSRVPSVTAVSGGAPVVIMRSSTGSVTVTNVSGRNQ